MFRIRLEQNKEFKWDKGAVFYLVLYTAGREMRKKIQFLFCKFINLIARWFPHQ